MSNPTITNLCVHKCSRWGRWWHWQEDFISKCQAVISDNRVKGKTSTSLPRVCFKGKEGQGAFLCEPCSLHLWEVLRRAMGRGEPESHVAMHLKSCQGLLIERGVFGSLLEKQQRALKCYIPVYFFFFFNIFLFLRYFFIGCKLAVTSAACYRPVGDFLNFFFSFCLWVPWHQSPGCVMWCSIANTT